MMKHLTKSISMILLAFVAAGMWGCVGSPYQKGVKNYKPDDVVAAVRELKPLADRGDAAAQFNLGSLYYQGFGVRQDYPEAIRLFRRAAEQSYPYALVTLGTIYAEGVQGVIAKDYPQALMWFIFAAAGGDREALELRDNLAVKMTPSQIVEAQKMAREFKPEDAFTKLYAALKPLAEKGDAEAQLKMGLMHYSGRGAALNYQKALEWFKKSGQLGNPLAQANVAYMYEKGEGVTQNYTDAAAWYLKAAQRGNAPAQFALGSLYEDGIGVKQDEVQALMWFNLAAARGITKARIARDRISVWLTPAQIDEAQRLAREFKVVEK